MPALVSQNGYLYFKNPAWIETIVTLHRFGIGELRDNPWVDMYKNSKALNQRNSSLNNDIHRLLKCMK